MILNFTEELPPLTKEEVCQVFINTLDLLSGFSILFLQCSPAEANQLIPRVRQEFPKKNIEVLNLVEPIDNLYKLVECREDRDSLNILFVRGLEKSLQADIKPGYKGLGEYYNLNTVPPILSHLNQQRENFRDHFGNICFVFVLPKFAIKYFVRRAPDFYDWNSGLFEIPDPKSLQNSHSIQGGSNVNNDLPLSNSHSVELKSCDIAAQKWYQKIFASVFKLWSKDSEIKQKSVEYERSAYFKPDDHEVWFYRGNSLANLGRYEEAIESYDRAISFKHDKHEAWYNRGVSLGNLGRYEEAIESYDRAISFKHDKHEAWSNRGVSLANLGRYEEATESYDRAISFKHDKHEAWSNRGVSLDNLGRYEEATESYDRAISFKHDQPEAWSNRGVSLANLGRYEEAIKSYDRAISFKHDLHEAWSGRAIVLRRLGRYPRAFDSYDQAIAIKPDEPQYFHNKGFAYFKLGRYPESINCFEQSIAIQTDKYDSWHDKGLVHFVVGDYLATLTSWQQAFNYIGDPQIPRYYEDISGLIQEFIEELLPRFTQPLIQQTLLTPLLEIYKKANVITELGAALVNTLHLIVAPTISDHIANQWLSLWRTSSLGNEPAMEQPLRLMSTAIEYKKDPSKRQRLWLNLPSEERLILDKALKLVA
jgi:tetratricopeptide (TPR) repeat protein